MLPILLQNKNKKGLVLDKIPPVAAYSLRKLRTKFTGNPVRIRRSGDNSEFDIPFSGTSLDITNLLSYIRGENLLNYSEDFTNAYWTKTRSTVTGNTTTATDGNLTADSFLETAVTNTKTITKTLIPFTMGIKYSFSVYVKNLGGRFVRLMLPTAPFTVSKYITFDPVNGVIANTSGTPESYGVDNMGNGWYRIYIVATATVTTTGTITIQLLSDANTSNYTGDITKGAYIWGAQIDSVGYRPYQVAVASTVPAESAYVSKWYDQSGNGNDASQATLANQPRIVNAGVIDIDPLGNVSPYYNGTTNYLSIPFSTTINPNKVSLVTRTTPKGGAGAYRTIISSRMSPSPINGYILYAALSDKYEFWTGDGSGYKQAIGSNIQLNTSEKISATNDSAISNIYADSVLSATNNSATLAKSTTNPTFIGAGSNESTPTFYYNGNIQTIIVFNFVLTQSQIQKIKI